MGDPSENTPPKAIPKRRCCNHVKDLNILQYRSIEEQEVGREQVDKRKSLTEEELKDAINGRFMRPSFQGFAAGFKAVYCNFGCENQCANPYDKDFFSENEKYDLVHCREFMLPNGLLETYTKVEDALRVEIYVHKYYQSIEKHKDVGWEAAELDYVEKHLKNFIEGASSAYIMIDEEQKETIRTQKETIKTLLEEKKTLEEMLACGSACEICSC